MDHCYQCKSEIKMVNLPFGLVLSSFEQNFTSRKENLEVTVRCNCTYRCKEATCKSKERPVW